MTNLIKYTGKIIFDPEHLTDKHITQSVWKKVVIIDFGPNLCEYYQWFIKKRFNLALNKPVRNAHVTLINVRESDITPKEDYKYNKYISYKENKRLRNKYLENKRKELYDALKLKWNGKKIEVTINLGLFGSGKHWWFNVDHAHRGNLYKIREELGLGLPKFGLHMTVGYVSSEEKIDFSNYLISLHNKGFIELNDF